MKTGLFISAAVILVFAIVMAMILLQPADRPSKITAAEGALKKRTLPDDLPALFEPNETGAKASDIYIEMLQYYIDHEDEITGSDSKHVVKLGEFLIRGMKADGVDEGFLDDKTPMMPLARSKWKGAMQEIPMLVVEHAHTLHNKKDQSGRATELSKAAFAFGLRVHRHNRRLWYRFNGLDTIQFAARMIYNSTPEKSELGEKALQWDNAVDTLMNHWKDKFEILHKTVPPAGDVINMAENDEDISFRAEAILTLGMVKMNPGHRGNLRVANNLIESAKASDDKFIREAAEGAEKVDKDYIHKL